jgi:hypothetical protein
MSKYGGIHVTSLATSVEAIVRAIIATLVLLAVVIILTAIVQPSGLGLLGVIIWLDAIGVSAAGVFLIARARRPLAGAGAIVCAVAVWLAFFWLPDPSPFIWTVAFFVGIGLIVAGTQADTIRKGFWPLLITRVLFGWAWIDNAQDHFRGGWFPGGAAFGGLAKSAADRKPTFFLDPIYQAFASGTLLPQKDLWAGLTASGELTFGLLLAVGLFGSLGAAGTLWQSLNYVFVKGTVVHGAYSDKVFFAADLLSLVTSAGLIYGLDASLRSHVPSWVAETLMGVPGGEAEAAPQARPSPGLGRLSPS